MNLYSNDLYNPSHMSTMTSVEKSTPPTESQNGKTDLDAFDDLANKFAEDRKRPLFIMYYPGAYGQMHQTDVKDVYDEFRRRNWSKENPQDNLDVIIHTYGGMADVGYRIAQVIRDFTRKTTFLVPEFAFSGGTLLCLSGNSIKLAHSALLSPIDVAIQEGRRGRKTTELVAIDYYMQFAQECRESIETMFRDRGMDHKETRVESDLLVELVKQVGAIQLGTFYRMRKYTQEYATKLMIDYMFADRLDKEHIADEIVNKLLFEYPSHGFVMDYHICQELGLPVEEMNEKESDDTKKLIQRLEELGKSNQICKNVDKDYKIPFFRLYGGSI
jgi:ATP-dependent protease ClpP protease subunit